MNTNLNQVSLLIGLCSCKYDLGKRERLQSVMPAKLLSIGCDVGLELQLTGLSLCYIFCVFNFLTKKRFVSFL
ncbi:hypothetical protein PRUPE_6G108200 [Prunus persica]|uniref:Uncharacterized protein n=1 Tax=Prunus persica TaxID=3760 RepID=A0A251NNG9_PRUPE|nr:hypothetical protein PRUPE_6G108200 [Prunus persica]